MDKHEDRNDNANDFWIINGKVYDLSKWLDFHPGGSHILLMNRGRDCTELFFGYHISSRFSDKHFSSILSKYYVRDANVNEIVSPYDWTGKNYELYLDLKKRVNCYFDNIGNDGNYKKANN
eukprot:295921_1